MENDLIINGKDAYKMWKVCMGSKFLDNLETPPPLKDYITSGSRTENGQRVIVSPRIDSRDVSLSFTVSGTDRNDFIRNRDGFLSVLQGGTVEIRVPSLNGNTYRLVYTGKNASYAMNRMRTFATITAKFIEPNPMNR